MNATTHFHYMSLALRLAELGCYSVSPNPMVGCIIVKHDRIVGQGFHQRAGEPHAEIHALQEARDAAQGANAYVTLEPCCHYGRTPPCVNALIQAGIKKVYVACLDPNPAVSGAGIELLRSAGINVEVGICAAEARKQNEIFFHYIRHKRPFVIAKWAMSLDGKTIVNPADSRNISCQESLSHAHQVRRRVDAILIGANTARHDNPQLTARLGKEHSAQQPTRIILSSQGHLSLDLKLLARKPQIKTIVATTDLVDRDWVKAVVSRQVEVLILPKNNNKEVHLPSLLAALGEKEITSVLVEGGTIVHEHFFKENLVNQIQFYLCPVIIGSLANKQSVVNLDLSQLGRDFYFSADFEEQRYV